MKKYLFFVFFISSFCFSQKEIKFKRGVEIVEKTIDSSFKKPKSILFVFEGDTHLINYYLFLTKKLKKKGRKYKIKTGFNYELSSKKPFESDLNSIPKGKNEKSNYENFCVISTSFSEKPKSWKKYRDIKKRKTQHILEFKMYNKSERETLFIKMDIHSYYTIVTESKKVSDIFFRLISSTL